MRYKARKIEHLRLAHGAYAQQIGVVPCELPTLVFFLKDFQAIQREACIRLGKDPGYAENFTSKHKRAFGMCSYFTRLIMVSMHIKRNRNLYDLEATLVHELVHYRWPNMKHGKRFENRVIEIIHGKAFERKHITMPMGATYWR